MLYTEEAVKANIRSREGKRVFFLGKNDNLTSAARDYLSRERIEIRPAQSARPERFPLLGGGYCEEKPEHMTHLDGVTLAPKTHPRIIFRGKMDTLEAHLILCRLFVPRFDRELKDILGYVRLLLRCEVLGEPVPEQKICGLTEQELRQHSHFPQDRSEERRGWAGNCNLKSCTLCRPGGRAGGGCGLYGWLWSGEPGRPAASLQPPEQCHLSIDDSSACSKK